MISKKKISSILIFMTGVMVLTLGLTYDRTVVVFNKLAKAKVIVIDAGHGGIDGGAVSRAGVSEKDINLAIAKQLEAMAIDAGWQVIMTREEDEGLYSDSTKSVRGKKTEDLKNRRATIEKMNPDVAVSIHLNSFREDASVRGAQTFYPSGSGKQDVLLESKALAEKIQEHLIKGIDDGTDRTVLGKKDVLLLKNPSVPTIIVECGFLSNKEEAELLQNEIYQNKIASCILNGIGEYKGWSTVNENKIRISN